jgi:uncharacterized membrane protein
VNSVAKVVEKLVSFCVLAPLVLFALALFFELFGVDIFPLAAYFAVALFFVGVAAIIVEAVVE